MQSAKTPQVILVTGTSSGFGLLIARSLAQQGHIVYGGLYRSEAANPESYADAREYAASHSVQLHPITLDVTSDSSIKAAVDTIIAAHTRIDTLVHNAGHMSWGPAEAFTSAQYLAQFETNCLSCHRLNQAVLPHMRRQRSGLLVWISSSSAHGPSQPYLAPYFAAKAAQDSLAQTTALEVSKWGIDSSIIVPGIFTRGTNHFAHAIGPDDTAVADEYRQEGSPMAGWEDRCMAGASKMAPEDADPQLVADAVVDVAGMERGKRPFRVHVEPDDGGAEACNAVRDWVRKRYVTRMDCAELLETKLN